MSEGCDDKLMSIRKLQMRHYWLLNFNTPCAKAGFCCDCKSPEWICRITTIIERKPRQTNLRVLIVNEEMGL